MIHDVRIRLSEKTRALLFDALEQRGLGREQIGRLTHVSGRTITDWKKGKTTMPADSFRLLVRAAQINIDERDITKLASWWNNSQAGKKGAAIRQSKHGQLGDARSRHKGGLVSYQKRRDDPTDIFARKPIRRPAKCTQLAEFIGIMIGDGNLTEYQISISLSSLVDQEYSFFVAALLEKLFSVKPSVSKRNTSNCIVIVASSKHLVGFLKEHGILQGHKIRQNLDIPDWIVQNQSYNMAALRGIFDTDGCVFQERHKIKDKIYSYPRLSLVSSSSNLRTAVHDILKEYGFTPKIRNDRSVNLESLKDIQMYFRIIGTNNPKHRERFRSFGGVG